MKSIYILKLFSEMAKEDTWGKRNTEEDGSTHQESDRLGNHLLEAELGAI